MNRQAEDGETDASIKALRLELRLQTAKVRSSPAASYPSPEVKLLIAMKQNLEIMMTNNSIDLSEGAAE